MFVHPHLRRERDRAPAESGTSRPRMTRAPLEADATGSPIGLRASAHAFRVLAAPLDHSFFDRRARRLRERELAQLEAA
jgi:hypothetical protein